MGLFLPEILLPQPHIDLEKWAVIACDQFTHDRGYWEMVKNTASGAPSTLNVIYPEVFLADDDRAATIENIHRTMEHYLADDVFSKPRTGCVYVERNTPYNTGRRGLVIAVDLEHYDWQAHARRLIRCTEGTVPERLPPRMDTRRGAALETPHVLLLIDDERDRLLPALAERVKTKQPVYRSKLMHESGDISGWFLDSDDDWEFIAAELEELGALARYQNSGADAKKIAANAEAANAAPFLFAVGDGNHSLAAAKEIWEEYKKKQPGGNADGLPLHPCRYALVEIENIYDPALKFEPIHRILFGIDNAEALALLSRLPGFSSRSVTDSRELARLVKEPVNENRLGLIARNGTLGETRYTLIGTSAQGIVTASLQPLLDQWLETRKNEAGLTPSIDYIHGADALFSLTEARPASGNLPCAGILLPPVKKSGLFETVAKTGPLPRKSFSMGEAGEKRFYLECRRLF